MTYALRTLSMDLVTLVATMGAWGYPVAGGGYRKLEFIILP